MTKSNSSIRNMIVSALMLALTYILPNLTGNIPHVGSMLLPMHLPVLLCGFLCGSPWGAAVGFLAPLMRSALVGMPPLFPVAISMAFEMAAYGFVAGFLYRRLPKTMGGIYAALIAAMLCGRVVWGAVMTLLLLSQGKAFTFAAFLAGGFTNAIPGILLQLVVIPLLVAALQKSRQLN